ncbi:ribonuclease H-like domain-containing protein [Tanacetum coccineum]
MFRLVKRLRGMKKPLHKLLHAQGAKSEGHKPPKNKRQASSSERSNIDQYDPLFLHSNDSSGVTLINFKLEGTGNYKIWNAAITIATHTKNKLGFLNEKLKRPKEEGFMQEQWDRCYSVVLNWILGCVYGTSVF